MRIESSLPWRCRALALIVLTVACLAVWSVALPPARAEAGSLVIPAWSFARGNARVYASPDQYADAGPVVGGGPEQPWGWTVEYDVDVPVTAKYTLQICYAAAEARPVEVFFDGRDMTKCCTGVTFGSEKGSEKGSGLFVRSTLRAVPAKVPDPFSRLTWNSSGAKWEGLHNSNPWRKLQPITKGKHTLKITRSGPLPHLVALRLDTPTDFPEDWKPPQYKVLDLESIPAADRKAFSKVAVLPPPVDNTPRAKATGSLMIPAWTFDRGNARIYASPDQYADAGPVVGGGPVAKKGSGTFAGTARRVLRTKSPDPFFGDARGGNSRIRRRLPRCRRIHASDSLRGCPCAARRRLARRPARGQRLHWRNHRYAAH